MRSSNGPREGTLALHDRDRDRLSVPLRPRSARHPRRREQPGARVSRRRGHPRLRLARRGGVSLRRGRRTLRRLRGLVGPDDPRARAPGRHPRDRRSRYARHELRRADRARSSLRRARDVDVPVDRNDARGVERHRSDDERAQGRARLHRPRRDREVRGLLPRSRRFSLGEGRLGRRDVRRPRLGGSSGGDSEQHGDARVQ